MGYSETPIEYLLVVGWGGVELLPFETLRRVLMLAVQVTPLPRARPVPAVFLDILAGAGHQHLLHPAIGGHVLEGIVVRVHGRGLHCACDRSQSDREVPGANSKS